MPDKYLQNNIKYINKVKKFGKDLLGKKYTDILDQFIDQLYSRSDTSNLENAEVTDLFHSALSIYEFSKNRKADASRQIRVYNPCKDKDGWETERTFVECNLIDSPFLLDTITQYLFKDERILHSVIHPIINLERNGKGDISKILPDKKTHTDNSNLESVIQIQIGHVSTEKEHKQIEKDLEDALDCVENAVNDWSSMTEKAAETIKRLESEKSKFSDKDSELDEAVEFLKWSLEDNFIFLGYRDFVFKEDKTVTFGQDSQLGVFNARVSKEYDNKIKGIPYNSDVILKNSKVVEITKSSRKSVVHRRVHMDYIGIKKYDDKGNIIGEERFLGLFTSRVYYQSAHNIPIIRKKIENVIERAGFRHNSHNGKALMAVLESHPRDELLQSSEEELFEIGMGIVSLSEKPGTRVFIRQDRFLRFYSCILFIPREFFTTSLRESIQDILEEEMDGSVMDYYTQVTESPLARVNVLIRTVPEGASDYLHYDNRKQKNKAIDVARIQQRIIEKTNSWLESLSNKLMEKFGEIAGESLYRKYVKAFPEAYKDSYHPGGATSDITKIENLFDEDSEDLSLTLYFDLYHLEKDQSDIFQLKLFTLDERINLSKILPIIENLGFHAIDEITFKVTPKEIKQDIWVHHFRLIINNDDIESVGSVKLSIGDIKDHFEETLMLLWNKQVENDRLNQLIARAGLDYRAVEILRAYSKYIVQINLPYSKEMMYSVLCKHPKLSRTLVELFRAKFDPDLTKKKRENLLDNILNSIKLTLNKVESVTEDRIISQFRETIKATLRTNFYQKTKDGEFKDYISFKFDSSKVPNMPKPIPYAEIFVHSFNIEGIHLRGGKVARGGLRWSDRLEDFRTEVLGLVKAQMVKNAVIVPVGSKGGFVVKNSTAKGRDEYFEEGKQCYRKYLSGLLDITDNIVDEKIVKPANVVCYDDDDPYLVVAADKGTATFSDIANEVAQSYNFWLDDAFASGGSAGYDHKKMGITARGAWVSVVRHFKEMGKNCQKEDFTCVGIGDMSGDVFGNGMLLSKHIRLVAAFNHMHIFIDPNPDAAKSYKERQRLFKLPRSSWMDYNKDLISKGGGIFDRKSKSIKLTKEIKTLLGTDESSVSPEDLIKLILKADVELLWNGGIGTYIKASNESHDQVGDKNNDSVRIDSDRLRCKIIGEGGNLGLTQKARIEFARDGGRVNTDAIDNSAGVDCSDHEVNIKIALGKAIEGKKLNIDKRNKLLEKMTDEVADLVLRDNELQTLAISIMEQKGHKVTENNIRLMEYLENQNRLDRNLEFLPSNEILHSRSLQKQGLTRPEISVLLAYSKLYIFDDLISSNLPDDDYFISDLFMYFPKEMQKTYKQEIENHQLRREIITTFISNSIVNRMGTTFFHRMKEETGMKGCDVSRAYTIVRDSFGLRDIWEEIENLDSKVPTEVIMQIYNEIEHLVETCSLWFLRNCPQPLETSKLVSEYKPGVDEIAKNLDKIVNKTIKDAIEAKQKYYTSNNIPVKLAKKIAEIEAISSSPDITKVASKTKLPIKIAGQVYFELGNKFKIGWLRIEAKKLFSDSHWNNLAIKTLISSLYDQQMMLTEDVLKKGCDSKTCELSINKWLEERKKAVVRYNNFIQDIKDQEKITDSMLTVAIERVSAILSE
jgi:glutamate dehydrogenase